MKGKFNIYWTMHKLGATFFQELLIRLLFFLFCLHLGSSALSIVGRSLSNFRKYKFQQCYKKIRFRTKLFMFKTCNKTKIPWKNIYSWNSDLPMGLKELSRLLWKRHISSTSSFNWTDWILIKFKIRIIKWKYCETISDWNHVM